MRYVNENIVGRVRPDRNNCPPDTSSTNDVLPTFRMN